MRTPADFLIVALDDPDYDQIINIINKTSTYVGMYKIGLSVFCSHGPKIVKKIQELGAKIFLDLKLFDIPMQVEKTLCSLVKLEPSLITIHALAGPAILASAQKVINKTSTNLAAVTILTSINRQDYAQLEFKNNLHTQVNNLANIAYESGISHIVCSAQEAKNIKNIFGQKLTTICPGIRSEKNNNCDQARINTAYEAIRNNADYLVVGRPITRAANIAYAAQNIHEEITRSLGDKS